MIYAGNAIDCTLGVALGLSTLTAASVGALVSNICGVVFGNTLEATFGALGMPRAQLSSAQRQLPLIKHITFAASVFGIVLGGLLGLLNLLVIDTAKSSTLKLHAMHDDNDDHRFAFTIEASNAARPDVTCLTVSGPDVDGLLASLTAALAARGCSIVEIHASRRVVTTEDDNDVDVDDSSIPTIHDVFYVVDQETGQAFEDEDLEDLAQGLLDATRTPVHHVQAALHEMELKNTALEERIQKLERILHEKQISIVTSNGQVQQPPKTKNNNNNAAAALVATTSAYQWIKQPDNNHDKHQQQQQPCKWNY